MKSEFRTNQSLSTDIKRIESSITKNQSIVKSSMARIKDESLGISSSKSNKNGIETQEKITNFSTTLLDAIDMLENDMISIEGIDLFDMKSISPDIVIQLLRKLKDHSRQLNQKVENQIKLIIKAKGKGDFIDEIESTSYAVHKALASSEELAKNVNSSLNQILFEVDDLKEQSKILLQKKIL